MKNQTQVYISWGTQLLRLGKYAEARERFHSATNNAPSTASVAILSRNAFASIPDSSELLAKILETLESHRPPTAAGGDVTSHHPSQASGYLETYTRQLRDEYMQLATKILPGSVGSRTRVAGGGSTPASPSASLSGGFAPSPIPRKGSPNSVSSPVILSPSASASGTASRVLSPRGTPLATPVKRSLMGAFAAAAADSPSAAASGMPVRVTRKTLDPIREQECMFYLHKYGTAKDKVSGCYW